MFYSKSYISFISAEEKPIFSTKIKEVIGLNWKTMIISHWKPALTLLSLSLFAITIISGTVFTSQIDCPGGG
jgi:hypothetical protein